MKSLKSTAVVIGIITAIITLLSTSVNAENLDQKDKNKKSQKMIINEQELVKTERSLIANYLEKVNIPEVAIEDPTILVYDTDGHLVYKGKACDAQDMLNKSSFLVEFDNEKLYTLY